ncbi:hypothetical protein [Spiroplasma tabanidicola]|uniref:Uncharacterized protein n=1 Tax=Spiroplasma tabanidicola TaxID=324079 RepID=A0A6I6C9K5_9MOLU|nr:hypothetical protein [Spiroplasma tabanidicola]QGS52139.1 hypothetical protein STABA_v1c07830 [Spiroplasma tabanidicola]
MPTNEELLNEIEKLKKEINIYKEKEDYINQQLSRSQEMYKIAKHNAQKIIIKSVDIAYEIKDEMEKCLNIIKNQPNNFQSIVEKFLEDNGEVFNYSKEEVEEIAQKIVDNIKI